MNATFLDIITVWELVAIALVLVITAYLISNLLAHLLRPPKERWYRKSPTFPMVSVVIPVYNEPTEIVRATIASWKSVRYPAFELIVADDSTLPLELDDPSIRVIRRPNRDGFKGGALRNAFQHLDPASEWMVVFDADFLVNPDVLVRFTEHYGPGVGGVQGCMSMGRNERPTFLTRYSESFHAVANALLAGRYRLHGFVGVQGAVQAYRVEAIRSIGGLAPTPTANEDLDTTFRLRKAGWKIVYDPRIVGRGIAPDRYGVFFRQLTRWTSTTVREYRRHLGSFLRSPSVPRAEKIDSVLFLLTWTNALVVTPTLAFLPWALLYVHVIPLWMSILLTTCPVVLFTLPILAGTPARISLIGWLGYYFLLLPGFFVMFRASLLGLFTDPGFQRTPKDTPSALGYSPPLRAVPEPAYSELKGPASARPALQRLSCSKCGNPLSHKEVLFYAVGALDIGELACRRCLRSTVGRPPRHALPSY